MILRDYSSLSVECCVALHMSNPNHSLPTTHLFIQCPIHGQPLTCSFNIPFMANLSHPLHSRPTTHLFIQYFIHTMHGQPLTFSFNIPFMANHSLFHSISYPFTTTFSYITSQIKVVLHNSCISFQYAEMQKWTGQ